MRHLELKDAKRMMICLNDKEVTRFMKIGERDFSIEDCKNYIKNCEKNKDTMHFAITDENDNWIGTVSLKNISNKEAEYAIILSKTAHGKGYSQKSTKEILNFAFNNLNLNKVYLYVSTTNIRANKFYLKFGWKLDKTENSKELINGMPVTYNWYSISKNDKEIYE